MTDIQAGAIFVSLYSHNRIDRCDPATGATAPFAELPAPPVGLAFDADGSPGQQVGPFARTLAMYGESASMVRASTGPILLRMCSM
jgi:hypothetical protein